MNIPENAERHGEDGRVEKEWEKKIKDQFIKTQCEQNDDSERYSVYENDGELVADWWINKISQLLIDQKREWVEEKKREINSWRYSYDNYPTMMINKESFEKGGLARELAQELIKSLEE